MKIITWNMHRRPASWTYLLDVLRPDLALLQEAKPSPGLDDEHALFARNQHEGTAVYSRTGHLKWIEYNGVCPDKVAMAVFKAASGKDIVLASLHVPTKLGRVIPIIRKIIDAIEHIAGGRSMIFGGDLNAGRRWDLYPPSYGHTEYFDSLDARGYVNCYWKKHGQEVQTFFRRGTNPVVQNDHLFITADLLPMQRCEVVKNDDTLGLSEHIPVVVTLKRALEPRRASAPVTIPDDHAYETTIRIGRAYVRLIDATRSLLELAATDEEREYLQGILSRYRPLLRDLLAPVPDHIARQVLAASQQALGPMDDVGQK